MRLVKFELEISRQGLVGLLRTRKMRLSKMPGKGPFSSGQGDLMVWKW